MSDIGIKISALLKGTTGTTLQQDLNKYSKSLKIPVGVDLKPATATTLQQELNRIAKGLTLNVRANVIYDNNQKTPTQKIDTGVAKSASNSYVPTVIPTKQATQANDAYTRSIDNLIHRYKMKQLSERGFINAMEKQRSMTEFNTLSHKKQEQVMGMLTQTEKTYQRVVDSGTKIRQAQAQQAQQTMKQQQANTKAQTDMLTRMSGMQGGTSGRFMVGDNLKEFQRLQGELKNLDVTSSNFRQKLGQIDSGLKQVSTSTSNYRREVADANKYTNLFGQSIFEAGKKFAGWMAVATVIMGITNFFRNLVTSIYEVDKSLVSLKKITSETAEVYDKVLISATKAANELGKPVTAMIDSIKTFAMLGYTMEQSIKLGSDALLLANVGLMDTEQATRHLISTLKGFSMEANESMRIIDSINDVGKIYCPTM